MSEGVILLVEDEAKLNYANRRALEIQSYTVFTALNLAQARERLESTEPDVILLDVNLPDGSGFDFCTEIRDKTTAHILFLTAHADQEAVLNGLSCGGDDYITKPFHVKELLLRVHAAMRRRQISLAQKTLTKGELTLNLVSDTAFADGKDLLLTQKEFHILRLLMQNEGKPIAADYIFEAVWERRRQKPYNNHALRDRICQLRKKLEAADCSCTIASEYGKGYFFKGNNVNEQ